MSMRSSTFRSTVAILWSVCNESRPIYCQADLNVLPVTKFWQKCQLCHIILYVSLWINLSFFHRLVVHFVCNDESYSCEIITTELDVGTCCCQGHAERHLWYVWPHWQWAVESWGVPPVQSADQWSGTWWCRVARCRRFVSFLLSLAVIVFLWTTSVQFCISSFSSSA